MFAFLLSFASLHSVAISSSFAILSSARSAFTPTGLFRKQNVIEIQCECWITIVVKFSIKVNLPVICDTQTTTTTKSEKEKERERRTHAIAIVPVPYVSPPPLLSYSPSLVLSSLPKMNEKIWGNNRSSVNRVRRLHRLLKYIAKSNKIAHLMDNNIDFD